ncbi:MAG: transposase [Alphaproteobacteria bacterium]
MGAGEGSRAETGRHRRFTPEEIVKMLREADVRISHGERVGAICADFGVSEQSYYRWRRRYGGLRIDQARRMRQLERENTRLRKLVALLTADREQHGGA